MSADKIFRNCKVYTLDKTGTIAGAIAVKGESILAIGSSDAMDAYKGPETSYIDLGGKTVIPGLIDSHAHFTDYGLDATRSADLTDSRSISEVLDRLRTFRKANPDMPWLLGTRFDQEMFAEKRWITREDLDKVSSDTPIMISRLCLHAIVANSAALKAVEGKLSDEQKRTGILAEDATGFIWQQIPAPTPGELRNASLWAFNDAKKHGLTGVHCVINQLSELDAIRSLWKDNQLPIRVRLQVSPYLMKKTLGEGLVTGSGDNYLSIGSLKLFMDGSMGARTSALKEPYTDDPGNVGELFMNEKELAEIVAEADSKGYQTAVHAIGDLAVECALKGMEIALSKSKQGNKLRHRIEHASQVSGSIIKDFVRLNIPACIQPQFVLTDFWTPERVGPERYKWSYPFKTMLDAGVFLAMGSDCPVERLDPFELIYRAVNREPLSLIERLSVEETVRAYSYGSAYVGFNEDTRGSIEPGKLADFVVLSQDIFSIDPSDIINTGVEQVIISGNSD